MTNSGEHGRSKLRTLVRRLSQILPIVAPLFAVPLSAAAQDFYKGKTLSLAVGYAVGGGYDQYARLLARHMERRQRLLARLPIRAPYSSRNSSRPPSI